MRFTNLAIFSTVVISIFLISCSAKSTSTLPVSQSEASNPITKTSKDATHTEWEKALAGAKKEGKVVVYGAYGLALARDPLIKAFREKFGIDLDITIAGGDQLTRKLFSERAAGIYLADVYMGGSTNILFELIPKNSFDPIAPYLVLPEVKDPSAWLGGSLPFWESKRVVLASLATIISRMAINNTMVKQEELTSYKDLLQSRLKGKMVIYDPTTSGGGRAWVTSTIRFMGTDYIKELKKQEPMLIRDFRLMTEWLAHGKYAVGIGVDWSGVWAAIRDGAPLNLMPVPKEGIVVGAGGGHLAVVNQRPHPNSTIIFTNWILGKEGQTVLSRAVGYASRRIDVPTDHLDASMRPGPGVKLVWESDTSLIEDEKNAEFIKEVFAPLLK